MQNIKFCIVVVQEGDPSVGPAPACKGNTEDIVGSELLLLQQCFSQHLKEESMDCKFVPKLKH